MEIIESLILMAHYFFRYQMSDWDGVALTEALAQRHRLPSFMPMTSSFMSRDWQQKV
jgi:hypothetical protein